MCNLKYNETQTFTCCQVMEKTKKTLQWKFEQNWIIGFRVMGFWSFSNCLLCTSSSWQLRQNLWCHCRQLSIGYVQRVPLFVSLSLKIIFPVVYFFSMSLLHHVCIISERMRIIAPLTVCKNNILWKSM